MTMENNANLEKRVSELERIVADLQQRLQTPPVNSNWMENMKGCVNDVEAFREAMEYGREFRHSDRPPDDPSGTP
jgi:hypothetical protein